jgi:hypothetical protein
VQFQTRVFIGWVWFRHTALSGYEYFVELSILHMLTFAPYRTSQSCGSINPVVKRKYIYIECAGAAPF